MSSRFCVEDCKSRTFWRKSAHLREKNKIIFRWGRKSLRKGCFHETAAEGRARRIWSKRRRSRCSGRRDRLTYLTFRNLWRYDGFYKSRLWQHKSWPRKKRAWLRRDKSRTCAKKSGTRKRPKHTDFSPNVRYRQEREASRGNLPISFHKDKVSARRLQGGDTRFNTSAGASQCSICRMGCGPGGSWEIPSIGLFFFTSKLALALEKEKYGGVSVLFFIISQAMLAWLCCL